MFGFRRKKPKLIRSVKDLSDSRAREIVNEFGLSIEDILPFYNDLDIEADKHGGDIESDLAEPQETVIKRLASAAVVAYELESRKRVRFLDGRHATTLTRTRNAGHYGAVGRYYEGVARRWKDEEQL